MSFSDRSTRTRVVAKGTLCLWLFGFVAGAANACLFETGRDPQGLPNSTVLAATRASDDCHHAVDPQTCKGLRELEQAAVVKAKVQQVTDGEPALGGAAPWRPSTAAPSPTVRRASATPPPGPPVAILFLRLTL